MTNIAMLVVCLLVGTILRKTRRVPDNAHVSINAFIIHVALPALILRAVQRSIHEAHCEESADAAESYPMPRISDVVKTVEPQDVCGERA